MFVDWQCLQLDLNSDTVESFRLPISDGQNAGIDIIACGTYQLMPELNRRIGRLYLYSLSRNDPSLSELCKLDSDYGILDMHCQTFDEQAFIYAATAGGSVDCFNVLYSADGDFSAELQFKHDIYEECEASMPGNVICLAVDGNQSRNQLVTSTNTGHLCFIDTAMQKTYSSFSASDDGHELWTCAFDKHNPDIVYSGGDDCRFKVWDQRSPNINAHVFRSKQYMMGITCMQKSPHNENLIAIGSYDEYLRFFDTRNMSKPVCVEETRLSGGVWRVKFHPQNPSRLVCACMHGGFDIIDMNYLNDNSTPTIKSKNTFTKHGSLAYGVDWIGDSNLLTSCSFYDNQLRLWESNEIE